LVVVTACGGDSPSDPGNQITGRERIGWEQPASSQEELGGLRYLLWIDDVSGDLSGVTYESLRAGSAACTGALRPMSPGQHRLALSAVAPDGTQSAQSAPIFVTVVSASRLTAVEDALAPTDDANRREQANASSSSSTDGPVRVDTLAAGPNDVLGDVTDLAATADGRVFTAARDGAVRVWSGGVLRSTPVLALDDVVTEGGSGLLSLALAPDYDRSGYVYVAYTALTGFRIARYRDVADTWAERAVVFEIQPDSAYTAALLRFGPDGRLYLALDDEGDPQARGDLGSFSGKVLRLNPDGSVPEDQPGYSPVHVADVRRPRGLGWVRPDRLWIANGEGAAAASGTLDVARADVTVAPRTARRVIVARYALPDGDTPAAAVLYRGKTFAAWDGDLLVSLQRSGQLLRLDLDPANPDVVLATDIVLDGTDGPARAMAVASDGTVFVATEQRLLRLSPRS
jgi:glucose/arabinose dehydrogenase